MKNRQTEINYFEDVAKNDCCIENKVEGELTELENTWFGNPCYNLKLKCDDCGSIYDVSVNLDFAYNYDLRGKDED